MNKMTPRPGLSLVVICSPSSDKESGTGEDSGTEKNLCAPLLCSCNAEKSVCPLPLLLWPSIK